MDTSTDPSVPAPGYGPRLLVLFESRGARPCRERALVLQAVGIANVVTRFGENWIVGVGEGDAQRAHAELVAWERENVGWPPRERPYVPRARPLPHAVGWAALLLVFFALQRSDAFGLDWYGRGLAVATEIRGSEPWRAMTALCLHGSLHHVLSNVVWGAFFSTLAVQSLGGGLGWASILLAGTLGNYANAWISGSEHRSLGASTAVFAALGVLAATTWGLARRGRLSLARKVAPIGGGLFFLAWLGFGGDGPTQERVDVLAHVLGFAAGVLLGGILSVTVDPRLVTRGQDRALLGGTLIALAAAWTLALR